MDDQGFELSDFLPYLLNQAAEALSLEFNRHYKEKYGMLRTEWRVLFHLGHYGAMTATAVCDRAALHKTKVSRAVAALEAKRFLSRAAQPDDRRHEVLNLTRTGRAAFDDLYGAARNFDAQVAARFAPDEARVLRRCLAQLAGVPPRPGAR